MRAAICAPVRASSCPRRSPSSLLPLVLFPSSFPRMHMCGVCLVDLSECLHVFLSLPVYILSCDCHYLCTCSYLCVRRRVCLPDVLSLSVFHCCQANVPSSSPFSQPYDASEQPCGLNFRAVHKDFATREIVWPLASTPFLCFPHSVLTCLPRFCDSRLSSARCDVLLCLGRGFLQETFEAMASHWRQMPKLLLPILQQVTTSLAQGEHA
eukprot:6193075-Pleurochrysis_carterae.AAC.1